jgi:hypothetical protein
MRSGGLTAADWATITQYIDALKPLKHATERLEGRGKRGKYGAIYEVILVMEYLLSSLEAIAAPYEHVDFEANEAPEDHLPINIRAAWRKANSYYNKLDNTPPRASTHTTSSTVRTAGVAKMAGLSTPRQVSSTFGGSISQLLLLRRLTSLL